MAEFKTYSMKAGEVNHKWIVVDGAGVPMGRMATFIVSRLTGKYSPSYTPHMDSGDYVVVINADQMTFGGDRAGKMYYRHSEYPGALKEISAKNVSNAEMLERAVNGMLPKNKLRNDRMARLRVFGGSEHDHMAQQPEKVEVK
ncbi:MAG: 50S ribosomal protein L13 [Candidatus Saccharibacteria bacterium]|nr:50S ribosomal protein L13 [Candidatus Saccharibacteria bacterium]